MLSSSPSQRLFLYILFILCLFSHSLVLAQTPKQNAIATAHPLATKAGKEILQLGGNAFDAAVAISAALAVVEPYSSGLGGGGFWLLHQADTKQTLFLDGREKAPLKAQQDLYLDDSGNYIPGSSVDGPLAAGIPGSVAALVRLSEEYGQLDLKQSLAPAIRYAREGFAVTPHYQRMIKFRLKAILKSPGASEVFLANNKVPKLGHIIRQADLANTIERIALYGKDGFYQGPVAQALVKGVQEAGGIWTLDDLKQYQTKMREPVRFNYQGLSIYSAPPPSSGGIALNTILNILTHYPISKLAKVEQSHLIVEAMRRAYRDRAQYLGDEDFVSIPKALLSSADYAAGLSAGIHPKKATPSQLLPGYQEQSLGRDTTHFVVMDQQGNSVSSTMSINYPFGSGYIAPGTGILLNDEMDDFAAKPGEPNVYGLVGAKANAIAAGKRPLSSMSPTYIESKEGIALIGTPGGSRIITMVLLGILDSLVTKDPKHWVNLPRFHHQYLPDHIQYEKDTFSEEQLAQLKAMGHKLKQVSNYGNMQALWWDFASGEVTAASDKRGEGQAISFSLNSDKK